MIDQMTNPSKGFEEAIRKHFFLKRDEVMEEVKEWLQYAEENKANYASLVECHNHSWCQKFKEEGKYKSMLKEIIEKLESTFKGLKEPSLEHEFSAESNEKKNKVEEAPKEKAAEPKKEQSVKVTEEESKLIDEVDVEDDVGDRAGQSMNIDDDSVKDRWSRYIGAMGIDSVAKQANARILVYGLGGLGAEIAKNLVLAGCKELTLCDNQLAGFRDLSSNFFLNEKDISTNRAAACVKRVQQLNYYVKVSLCKEDLATDKSIEAAGLKDYDVVILTEASLNTQKLVNDYCRKNNSKFITADVNGVFCRVFNDFGDEFEVIDKNGEEIKELMIQEISCEKEGLVTLQKGFIHPFEDGDEVIIEKVIGMTDNEGKSINGTIHKVTTVTPSSFKIGDTSIYSKYEHSGLAKQIRSKLKLAFKSLSEVDLKNIPHDENLLISDFEKMEHNNWSHICYEVVQSLKLEGKMFNPISYTDKSFEDSKIAVEEKFDELLTQEGRKELEENAKFRKFFAKYCVVESGTFNPLCAFIGGFVSQEAIKAITNKFVPVKQFFYYDASEIVPDIDVTDKNSLDTSLKELGFTGHKEDRYSGIRQCIGETILNKIQQANIFMIGAGAIGCELLKNYAMLGIGSQKDGSVLVTDPDVIEVSNLNRQFLFREKHLRKPKSVTAAAAAIHMNPDMKGRIIARLDKIHKGTEDSYSQSFYKSLNVVTNALDNVQARRYLDGQCVKARIPMLDSGTLGPKGHVQVVLPNKTESYSSTNDPEDTTEIPHCTLKMFPEETLHCVEWARDLFSQLFSQSVKSYNKLVQDDQLMDPKDSEQKKIIKEALSLIEDRPTDFKSCIRWARFRFNQYFVLDIKQLLHAYPLDHKTKDGKPFWSLPKRAPIALKFSADNEVHAKFIAAAACLRATIFNIEIPFKVPRDQDSIKKMANIANEFSDEVPEFKLDKSKIEAIKAEVDDNEEEKKNDDTKDTKEEDEEETIDTGDDIEEILEYAIKPLRNAIKASTKEEEIKTIVCTPQEFEKDNDANFHIDFIYALANCRAENYTLDLMDWITTKLKAGRIIPALATTTSSIAGLQTLELVKILNEIKFEDMRNINLNLAVPSLMASEPGAPQKFKLREGLEVTVWDLWSVHFPKDATLNDLIKKLQKKYKLDPKDIFKEGYPIYLHALDGIAPTGKKEKTLGALFKIGDDETQVEITVTFSNPEDKEEKILEGTPNVLIKFT
jgi:ubiquitin-activating enzyme E1